MSATLRHHLIVLLLIVVIASLHGCSDVGDPVVPELPNGSWQTTYIGSHEYLNNRFFRLDLPADWSGDGNADHHILGWEHPDSPGRSTGNHRIDLNSVRVFQRIASGPAMAGDLMYAAATVDSTGIWENDVIDNIPLDEWVSGWVWRPITNAQFLLDPMTGKVRGIDVGQELGESVVLAVAYRVMDEQGQVVYSVGEDPSHGDPRLLEIDGELYYRLKLLKPNGRDEFTFQYVIRNIYSMGATNIDLTSYDLKIEKNLASDTAENHGTQGILYIQTHGLDRGDPEGGTIADGLVDLHDSFIIDPARGLLNFPWDMPFPFNSTEAEYRRNADPDGRDLVWEWEDTFLAENLTPEIYDWTTNPSTYQHFAKFRLTIRQWVFHGDDPESLGDVTLQRPDWYPASVPHLVGFDEPSRVGTIGWYSPQERVRRRLLEPDLQGSSRDATVPTLEVYLEDLDGAGTWGGIMTGYPWPWPSLTEVTELEIWVNDFRQDPDQRQGVMHVDVGAMSEDFAWPRNLEGEPQYDTFQTEDLNRDGLFNEDTEDVGLDAWYAEWEVVRVGEYYDAMTSDTGCPYPEINNTAANGLMDAEDLNGDDAFNTRNMYHSWTVDLATDMADVDVAVDHPNEDLQGTAWRRYVLPIDASSLITDQGPGSADQCQHLRIWFEGLTPSEATQIQLARVKFH